jgi:hypothetical protein
MPQDLAAHIQEHIATVSEAIEAQKRLVKKSSTNNPAATADAVKHLRELTVRRRQLKRNHRAAQFKS